MDMGRRKRRRIRGSCGGDGAWVLGNSGHDVNAFASRLPFPTGRSAWRHAFPWHAPPACRAMGCGQPRCAVGSAAVGRFTLSQL